MELYVNISTSFLLEKSLFIFLFEKHICIFTLRIPVKHISEIISLVLPNVLHLE